MMVAAGIVYAVWGALLWRVRGGAWESWLGLPPGTTRARAATAALFAAPLTIHTWWSPVLAASIFLGMACAGWGRAMDIGRVAGTRWGDALQMSAWGCVAVAPACFSVWSPVGAPWWPVACAGLLFGPIYVLAWHLPRLPHLPRIAAGPTEWAELACGAAVGAGLWVALA